MTDLFEIPTLLRRVDDGRKFGGTVARVVEMPARNKRHEERERKQMRKLGYPDHLVRTMWATERADIIRDRHRYIDPMADVKKIDGTVEDVVELQRKVT